MKKLFPNSHGPLEPKNSRQRTLFTSSLLLGILIAATGCQVLTYSGVHGEKFTRSSLGAKTSISSLSVESDTNGLRKVEMRGYENDSTQALGIVTEAAVRAALQGAKTVP